MKKKVTIPDDYFDNDEFIVDEIDEEFIIGILGPNPSAEQILKFELCTFISFVINNKKMSLVAVEKLTGINSSEISRIKNHHLERFTIDRLMKIYCLLDSEKSIGFVLKSASEKIDRLSA